MHIVLSTLTHRAITALTNKVGKETLVCALTNLLHRGVRIEGIIAYSESIQITFD